MKAHLKKHKKLVITALILCSICCCTNQRTKPESTENEQTIPLKMKHEAKKLKSDNIHPEKAHVVKKESFPDESNLKYYRVITRDEKHYGIEARAAKSLSAERTGYYSQNDCVVSYPESEEGEGGPWIRVFTPYKEKEKWILLEDLTLSDDCHESFVLAEDLFIASRIYLIETVIPYKKDKKRLAFNDILEIPVPDSVTEWIKSHSSETYALYSTYDEEAGDFCRTSEYCGPWYMKFTEKMLESRIFDLEEKLFYDMNIKDFTWEASDSEIIIKYFFIAVLHPGFEDGRIVFFHYPGAAHNSAWHFSKKGEKWVLDTIYLNTD